MESINPDYSIISDGVKFKTPAEFIGVLTGRPNLLNIDKKQLEMQRDAAIIAREAVSEVVYEQVSTAFKGYREMVYAYNDGHATKNHIKPADEATIAAETELWLKPKQVTLAALLMTRSSVTNPDAFFTLTAAPNVRPERKGMGGNMRDIVKVAEGFSKRYPKASELMVRDWKFYTKYTADELSGLNTNPTKATILSLTPRDATPGMSGSVKEQKYLLAGMQTRYPAAKVLNTWEAVAHWFTLIERGKGGERHSTIYDRIMIRHFDMEPKLGSRELRYVPTSFVGGNIYEGLTPTLGTEGIGDSFKARISVG